MFSAEAEAEIWVVAKWNVLAWSGNGIEGENLVCDGFSRWSSGCTGPNSGPIAGVACRGACPRQVHHVGDDGPGRSPCLGPLNCGHDGDHDGLCENGLPESESAI